MSPAEADGLVPELDPDVQRTRGGVRGNDVTHHAAVIGEVGIGGGFAVDGDVGLCRGFVEADGEQPVVLEVADGAEKAGGDVAVGIAEDGLVDLDLVGKGDLAEVRLESGGVFVVDVADNRAVGTERARFEDGVVIGIGDDDVQPRASRWIGGRELVAGEVLGEDGDGEMAGGDVSVLDSDLRCLCAEELLRALDGGFEVLRASDGLEIAAVLIEEMLDKEVGADEVVMTCAVAHLAVERGDGRGAVDGGHVAVLAVLLLVVGAVLPLLEGDLLGEVGDGLTVWDRGRR